MACHVFPQKILLLPAPCVCKCQSRCPTFTKIEKPPKKTFLFSDSSPLARMSRLPGPPLPSQAMADPFADWEEMFESGQLDASLRTLDLSKPPPLMPGHGPSVILQEREEGRSEYRPPEPKMTIMKRPDSGGQGRQEGQKPRTQQKSLKQREQEYAEARQRILGSQEEQTQQAQQPAKAKTVAPRRNGGPRMEVLVAPQRLQAPQGAPLPPITVLPPPNRGVAPYSAQRQYRGPPPHILQGPPPPLDATRTPRGPPPDGSRGFPEARPQGIRVQGPPGATRR